MMIIMALPPDDTAPPSGDLPPEAAASFSQHLRDIAKAQQKPDRRAKRQPLHPEDPWTDWRPQWAPNTVKKTADQINRPAPGPHDLQERHSPTETVSLRLSHERRQVTGRQRIVDARLWSVMTPAQQKAALCITRAFETMGRGLGYAASDWERIPGTGGGESPAERHARLIREYIDWTRACAKEKITHAMIIDILAFGMACSAVDRARRIRTGTARQNLLDGLALYCVLRGWR